MVAGRVRSVRREMGNPLYRNAYALMLNTVVNSGLGLLYWVFAARVFSTEDVGRGNAMVNLMMLISVLTSLNFGQALIRFLPTAGRDSRSLVRLAYGVSAGMAVVGSAAVMTYCHFAYAPGDPLHVSPASPRGSWSRPPRGPSSTCRTRSSPGCARRCGWCWRTASTAS